MYVYMKIYKEFCVGGSKQKQCFMCHIELPSAQQFYIE